MAEVDTSFYRIQPKSAFDYMQELAGADDAKAQRQRNALALLMQQGQVQDAQQARGIRNSGLSAVQALGGGATDDQRISALRGAGDYGTADTLEKSMLERQKTGAQVEKDKAATEKDRLANQASQINLVLQAVSSARDQPSYERAIQFLRSNGVELGAVPPQYDPQAVAAFGQMALTAKDRLEQVWKQKGFDIDAARAGETARHNKASEGLMARGQNMTDQRARDTAEQGKIPAGYRRGADGNLEFIPGGPADPAQINAKSQGKPLAGPVLKQLTEARDNSATIDRLATSFKDEYASKGVLGFGADTSLAAKGVLGSDKDSVEWWKNYRKQAELIERHSLFGAALTPTEQASWRSADIGPGMDAKVIARNLQTRQTLAKKVFENTRQDLIDAGNSEDRINAISSRNTEVIPQAGPKPGTVEQGYVFQGGDPADPKNWKKQ